MIGTPSNGGGSGASWREKGGGWEDTATERDLLSKGALKGLEGAREQNVDLFEFRVLTRQSWQFSSNVILEIELF